MLKLALWAILCALPFLAALVYLGRQVEAVQTLPLDEYRGLCWGPDETSLFFTHRALAEGAETELWTVNTGTSEFFAVAHFPSPHRRWLTGQFVGDLPVIKVLDNTNEELFQVVGGASRPIKVGSAWRVLPSQGKGLFFVEVEELEGEELLVSMEEAPEVGPSTDEVDSPTPYPAQTGLGVGRYQQAEDGVELLFSIPFQGSAQEPKIHMVCESPDQRFLALVVSFGPTGHPGLWVYDSEASRLLWTRIVSDPEVYGLAWSAGSESLALCDKNGLAVLGNVLGVESTRYEIESLGPVRPAFVSDQELVLIGDSSVHKLDRQKGQAETLFDARTQPAQVQALAVSPSGSRAAYFIAPNGYLELQLVELDSAEKTPQVLELPGSVRRLAEGTLGYQVGEAIRSAWRYWTGW